MKLFTLSCGRTLSYCEFGDPQSSRVILYGHGFPGTGHEAGIAHRAALKHGVRIISPSRPGIDCSSYDSGRTILSWPDTVNQLLQHLNITEISLLGVSGGTPYTLAYLYRFPERVRRCVIVSGMGPPDSVTLDRSMSLFSRVPIWCAYRMPGLSAALISTIAQVSKVSPRLLLMCYKACMSSDDKRLLKARSTASEMLENFRLALKQGTRGVSLDFRLLTSDWGFSLNTLTIPVTLLHGTADALVPFSIAQKNAAQIPRSSLIEYPGRGHFMAFEITNDIVRQFDSEQKDQAATLNI